MGHDWNSTFKKGAIRYRHDNKKIYKSFKNLGGRNPPDCEAFST
jgi:hypothetical protein